MTLLLLAVLLQERTSVEDVLRLMERNAAGVRDATFRVEARGGDGLGLGTDIAVDVAWRRGTGVRLTVHAGRRRSTGVGGRAHGLAAAYTPEAFYYWSPTALGAAVWNLRLPRDGGASKGIDPYFVSAGGIQRLFCDELLVLVELDPRLMLGFERSLEYRGLDASSGAPCHVLASSVDLAPDPTTAGTGFAFRAVRRQFHVEPATGRLALLRSEIDVAHGAAVRTSTFGTRPRARRDVGGGFRMPAEVRVTLTDSGREAGWMSRRLTSVSVNGGVAEERILSASEKADLYGDALLDTPAAYEAALAKGGGDEAVRRYNLAASRHAPAFFEMFDLDRTPKPPIVPDLVRVSELRPGAESPLANLFAVADGEPDAREAVQGVLAKVESGAIRGDRVRLAAAAYLNRAGEPRRALGLLKDRFGPGTAEGAAVERVIAHALEGDAEGLDRAFGEVDAAIRDGAMRVRFVRALADRVGTLDRLRSELGRSRDGASGTRAMAAAAFSDEAAPLAALFESAGADAAVLDLALERLDARAERPPEDWKRLAGALAKAPRTSETALQLGRALTGEGREEEAQKQFEAAMQICLAARAEEPAWSEAGPVLLRLGEERGPGTPEVWSERLTEGLLKLVAGGWTPPRTADVFDPARNPVSKHARTLLAAKRWEEFHRIASVGGSTLLPPHHVTDALTDAMRREAADAIRGAMREPGPEALKRFAVFARDYLEGAGAVEALREARRAAPADAAAAWLFAEAAASSDAPAAAEAYRAAADLLAAPEAVEGRLVTRAEALIGAARLTQDPVRRRETLDRIDLAAEGLSGSIAAEVGDFYAATEAMAEAIAAWKRAVALGEAAQLRIGLAYEKADEPYEALRWYNREIERATAADDEDDDEEVLRAARAAGPGGAPPDEERAPAAEGPRSGRAARERLVKRLGTDWIVDRFLKSDPVPLKAGEAERVARALKLIRGDGVADRDEALTELRSVGPAAAPALKELRNSPDVEVRSRVRALLLEWSEPR